MEQRVSKRLRSSTKSAQNASNKPVAAPPQKKRRLNSRASGKARSTPTRVEEPAPEASQIFRFFDLPAELRLHIYRAALCRDEPLHLHLPHRPEPGPDDDEYCARASPRPSRSGQCRHRGRHRISRYAVDGVLVQGPKDTVTPAILRICHQMHREARSFLYSENKFVLNLDSGIHTLESLRQRNRSLIKSVSLTIPSHHDILDSFADVVRLGLRYCWGLKELTITLPSTFPDDRYMSGTTNVYANAFHILRWLPKGCKVKMEGNVSETIMKVVADEGRLMDQLDDTEYLKRQHQMPERH